MPLGPRRAWPAIAAIAALCGFAIALYHYLAPMTGVTGTPGALVAVVASLLVLLLAGVLVARHPGPALVRGLLVAGAIGTGVVAWFLHASWLVVAMALVLLAVVAGRVAARGGPR